MFKKILIPLDLTEKHQSVLDIATDLARQSGGELILHHAIETIPGLDDDDVAEFYQRLEKKAKQHLERIGSDLTEKGVNWRSKVSVGIRVQEIARIAEEVQADLLIVHSPRFDPDNPGSGWASLSWKIGIVAHCPVLLVK